MDKLKEYDYYYHTIGEPIVSDYDYDTLKEKLLNEFPNHPYFKKVGFEISDCIKLPYYMGSLDKFKDDNNQAILRWKKKYNGDYLISDKLDGISALIDYKDDGTINIYTRGNGTCGRNINHILDYINIPKLKGNYAIRGELLLSKKNWNPSYGSNPRNVVAGLINSKKINKNILPKIDFVAYDLIKPRYKIKDSFEFLTSNAFLVSNYTIVSDFTVDSLSNILHDRKQNGEYEIDGIVIYDNEKVHNLKANENPKYSFAFKSMLQHEEVIITVKNIEWNASKDGYLKPRVLFEPIFLDGVNISAATGNNALYIQSNMIGVGSQLAIIRSGGVIPKISRVITQSNEPLMPNIPYKWNDTKVDIILIDNDTDDVKIKELTYFMKTLEIKLLAESTIKKLYENGFKTIPQLLHITIEDISKIDGLGEKSGEKIIDSIQNIKTKQKYEIMAASNIFGRNLGLKKLELICYNLHDKEVTYDNLIRITGIGKKNAEAFLENFTKFNEFYQKLNITPITKKQKTDNSLEGSFIVFSGFRDDSLKTLIQDKGGKVQDNVTKTTTLLIVKSLEENSKKIKDAQKLNIKIVTKENYYV